MNFSKKSVSLIAFFGAIIFLIPQKILAVCPICTIAVIGGVELSRWLGVDDTISGVWIGGLIVSMSLWLISWLTKKNIIFPFRKILVFASFYGVTILSLYWMKMVFYPGCSKIWGYDKIIVGMVVGTIFFSLGVLLNDYLKKRNSGKVYFPFQKVAVPLSMLIFSSIIFHLITKCTPNFLFWK